MQVIYCETLAELVEVCAMLTRQGMTYEAKTSNLAVKLLGGY